jgi:hypothetical protein
VCEKILPPFDVAAAAAVGNETIDAQSERDESETVIRVD